MRKNKVVLVAVLLMLALAPVAAFAALSAVGPVVPYIPGPPASGNGFPQYYTDTNGVSVDIQVPPFGDGLGLNPPTLIFAPVTVPPFSQFSVDIGFDVECFYYYLQPDRATFDNIIDPVGHGNGGVNIVLGLECGFATVNPLGAPVNGNQGTFQRVRFIWKTAPAGNYVFDHPYGTENLTVPAGTTGLKATFDTPVVSAGNFTGALGGPISVFCKQVSPAPFVRGTEPPGFNLPTNWLGDGFTSATFTGSPLVPAFNQFRFQAFTLAGAPNNLFTDPVTLLPTNTVTTNKAVIAGHIFVAKKKVKSTAAVDMLLLL